ncbi:MAG: transcription initiation factor IIB [Promethearchaeota archaeon]
MILKEFNNNENKDKKEQNKKNKKNKISEKDQKEHKQEESELAEEKLSMEEDEENNRNNKEDNNWSSKAKIHSDEIQEDQKGKHKELNNNNNNNNNNNTDDKNKNNRTATNGDHVNINENLYKFIADEPCCDNPMIKEEDGFYVCHNCGMTWEEKVLDASPRRAFTQEEINKRKSSEPVYSPIGPRTIIQVNADAKGTLLSPKKKQKYTRLSKIHRSLTTSYERNLWIALPNLQRLQERLALPDAVAEDALRIYTNAVKKRLTMGRSIDTILAASIFAALRIHGIPRTIEEIIAATELPKKNVVKSYRLILLKILPELNIKVEHFGPKRYIDKFSQDLKLSMATRNYAMELLEEAKKNGLPTAGKDPKGLAAAAIYLAARKIGEPKTQNQIAQLSHITEVTLRMRVKDILKFSKIHENK